MSEKEKEEKYYDIKFLNLKFNRKIELSSLIV